MLQFVHILLFFASLFFFFLFLPFVGIFLSGICFFSLFLSEASQSITESGYGVGSNYLPTAS